MGLFDRLLGSRSPSVKISGSKDQGKAEKKAETFYLDPDSSSSLGDVEFMRRSNTIRHTFPGNADSPGEKEMVQKVASMDAQLEKMTPGLAGQSTGGEAGVSLSGGVPKPVKKTFAQPMSASELEQRLKGSALGGTNTPGGAGKASSAGSDQPAITKQGAGAKAGAIDPFKAMAKDLNA
jgi:hypothetical protein